MSTAASPIRLLLADVDGTFLSARYGMAEEEVATIGDMPNDVLMFARSGLAIAMGQSGAEAHRAARRVTTSNEEDGVANARRPVHPASFTREHDIRSGGTRWLQTLL